MYVHLEPQNVILLVNKIVTKIVTVKSYWRGAGPKSKDWCPYQKRTDTWRHKEGKARGREDRDWSETSQQMLGIVSVHQKLGESHAASIQSQLPERTNLHGILISIMSSGTMIENVSIILNHLFGVLCSGSPEKLIYCRETCFILLIETLDRKCYSNPFTNFGKLGNAYQDEKTV